MDRILVGLSTRRYPVGLVPVGARTEKAATGTRSSRTPVAVTVNAVDIDRRHRLPAAFTERASAI